MSCLKCFPEGLHRTLYPALLSSLFGASIYLIRCMVCYVYVLDPICSQVLFVCYDVINPDLHTIHRLVGLIFPSMLGSA